LGEGEGKARTGVLSRYFISRAAREIKYRATPFLKRASLRLDSS
jgi:hypothetical protein